MPFGFLDKFLQQFKVVYRARFQSFRNLNQTGWIHSAGPAHYASPRAGERAGFESRAGSHLAVTHYAAKRYGARWSVGLEADLTAGVHLLHRDERGGAET